MKESINLMLPHFFMHGIQAINDKHIKAQNMTSEQQKYQWKNNNNKNQQLSNAKNLLYRRRSKSGVNFQVYTQERLFTYALICLSDLEIAVIIRILRDQFKCEEFFFWTVRFCFLSFSFQNAFFCFITLLLLVEKLISC